MESMHRDEVDKVQQGSAKGGARGELYRNQPTRILLISGRTIYASRLGRLAVSARVVVASVHCIPNAAAGIICDGRRRDSAERRRSCPAIRGGTTVSHWTGASCGRRAGAQDSPSPGMDPSFQLSTPIRRSRQSAQSANATWNLGSECSMFRHPCPPVCGKDLVVTHFLSMRILTT